MLSLQTYKAYKCLALALQLQGNFLAQNWKYVGSFYTFFSPRKNSIYFAVHYWVLQSNHIN